MQPARQHQHAQQQQQQPPKQPLSADAILGDYLARGHKFARAHQRAPACKTGHKFALAPPPPTAMATEPSERTFFSTLGCNLGGRRAGSRAPLGAAGRPADEDSDDSESVRELSACSGAAHAQAPIVHVQRKLLAFFYVYVALIASLYLTYAVYCYHQQAQLKRQQQQQQAQYQSQQPPMAPQVSGLESAPASSASASLMAGANSAEAPDSEQLARRVHLDTLQAKLEAKLQLLERYVDTLALELEDTRGRLRERERCACAIGCAFNGTRYADGQRWPAADSKCDICECRAGKISCAPRECPKLTCEQPVQLAGQCCPSCMKKCKLNQTLVPHGHTFRPGARGEPTKQCKCYDGLIKCEPVGLVARAAAAHASAVARNKTLEYLNSILGPPQQPQPQQLLQARRSQAAPSASAAGALESKA